MDDSVFSKIIKGEIPSYKIYEDDKTYAFLDIHPVQPGHTLVIPKKQIEFVWDLSDDDYLALMKSVKLVAKLLKDVLGVPYVGLKIEGVDVPHAHIHLIPFSTPDQFNAHPDQNAEPDQQELSKMAARLKF